MTNKKIFTIALQVNVKAVDEKTAIDRLSIMLQRRGFDFKLEGKVTSSEITPRPAKVKAVKEVKEVKPVAEKKDAKKPGDIKPLPKTPHKIPSIGIDED